MPVLGQSRPPTFDTSAFTPSKGTNIATYVSSFNQPKFDGESLFQLVNTTKHKGKKVRTVLHKIRGIVNITRDVVDSGHIPLNRWADALQQLHNEPLSLSAVKIVDAFRMLYSLKLEISESLQDRVKQDNLILREGRFDKTCFHGSPCSLHMFIQALADDPVLIFSLPTEYNTVDLFEKQILTIRNLV
jgi:hypothetical protein